MNNNLTREEKIARLKQLAAGKLKIDDLRPKTFRIFVNGPLGDNDYFVDGVKVDKIDFERQYQS